jgi:hypothetical protein
LLNHNQRGFHVKQKKTEAERRAEAKARNAEIAKKVSNKGVLGAMKKDPTRRHDSY